MDVPATWTPADRPRPGPAAGTVLPDYRGFGLANLPATIERHFGVAAPLPTLAPGILPPALLDGVEVIATLLIDALGYDRLQLAMARGLAPHLSMLRHRSGARLAPVTSIFPSVTPAALTTLGTGLAPGQHGIVGDKLHDAELGAVLQTLTFGAVPAGRSLAAGLDPAGWVGVPTVFERLAGAGVGAVVLDAAVYEHSALSCINYRGARFIGYHTLAELCAKLRVALAASARPAYLHAYWGELDTVGHHHGAGSDQYATAVQDIDRAIGQILLDGLRAPRTLLVILADHGQIDIPAARWVWLNDHPGLLALLRVPPTGDHRAVILHAYPGCEAAAHRYLEQHLAYCTTVLSTGAAIALGLYGHEPLASRVRERLGQLLVLPSEDWVIRYEYPGKERKRWQVGTHGGLAAQEMLVPLLACRLD